MRRLLTPVKPKPLNSMFAPLSGNAPIRHLNLKLAELGLPVYEAAVNPETAANMASFIARAREKDRLLANYLCPPDSRIQSFLYDYLNDVAQAPRLPAQTLVCDRPGLARVASLPPDCDEVHSPLLSSYRTANGVLHNPKSDRRTTEGVFHIADGGLPVPEDKRLTPRAAFASLLRRALQPPSELMRLPFTASQSKQAECWVSIYLRPLVCPPAPGIEAEQRYEVRFFAPGSLVSNLDFVESIFGNGGDPSLPENDAALDPEHWTGHTGCVILAPHLVGAATKKELGLPAWESATQRQRRDGMAWKSPEELYNDGQPFKLTARDQSGVIVTLLADNYYGYCKKEVKTQISFAANLFGLCEEEHAGGALVFPCYDLAGEYDANLYRHEIPQTFQEVTRLLGDEISARPEGYATDARHPSILYLPETAHFEMERLAISWPTDGGRQTIKLRLGEVYVLPSGFKVHLEKPQGNRAWRLVGARAEGVFCHKPCTVSGGGKSEISKPISDAIIFGPVFVSDFVRDFAAVDALLSRDCSGRFRDPAKNGQDRRPVLSPQRSLGSVIKLLTPSPDYNDEYNAWLNTVPRHIKELLFVVKRFWKPSWQGDWRSHFSVDIVNGEPSNELLLGRKKLATQFLRVGYDSDDQWRVFGLRKDFFPAAKLQMEDDITASVIVPRTALSGLSESGRHPSVKLAANVETRLFQRPDDAFIRGYDHQAEAEFTDPDNFFSNYRPMARAAASDLLEDAIGFEQFTPVMREFVSRVAASASPEFFVCTAFPRMVNGKPTKNPRYLQMRPDLKDTRSRRLAEVGARLARRQPAGESVYWPVNSVLAGRRNNAADGAVRSLACYGPIHFMELPELFMEFIASMTGKSPSTTGAGSEGAMTKGPFNALPPIYDLNAALTGFLVTGYDGFVTSAGCLGPHARVDHDISLLIPELWCRMGEEERDPAWLQAQGMLERLADFEFEGRSYPASRLGYRVTRKFVNTFFGRIFNHPDAVLTEEMLRPELQDRKEFADAVDNVAATHRRIAENYFADGSVEQACPPLKALLHIMRDGVHEGRRLDDPGVRALFSRHEMLSSDWYEDRLRARQKMDIRRWQRHVAYLEKFVHRPTHAQESERLGIANRLTRARVRLEQARRRDHIECLRGTIGGEPSLA